MSRSRRIGHRLHVAADRPELGMRDLAADEVDEVVSVWEDLTDEVVRILAGGDPGEAMARATEGRAAIASRYGGVSLLAGPVTAATHLARHARHHASYLDGIRDALWALDPPLGREQMAAATALTHGIMAEAAGCEATAAEATVLLLRGSEDAGAVASVVWWAFCRAGAEDGIGVTWCTGSDGAEVTELADDVGEALAATGAASALVELVGAGNGPLAGALAASAAHDRQLAGGVVACLRLLDRDGDPDEAAVQQICHAPAGRAGGGGAVAAADADADAGELLWLAALAAPRIGGGEGAGREALERLERWLRT